MNVVLFLVMTLSNIAKRTIIWKSGISVSTRQWCFATVPVSKVDDSAVPVTRKKLYDIHFMSVWKNTMAGVIEPVVNIWNGLSTHINEFNLFTNFLLFILTQWCSKICSGDVEVLSTSGSIPLADYVHFTVCFICINRASKGVITWMNWNVGNWFCHRKSKIGYK